MNKKIFIIAITTIMLSLDAIHAGTNAKQVAHVEQAYIIRKFSDGSISTIRILMNDGEYKDFYPEDVVHLENQPWVFKLFLSSNYIYVDKLIDIAVVDKNRG